MCRRDIPVEFLDHPELVYKIQDAGATTEDGYQWFYEGRNGKFGEKCQFSAWGDQQDTFLVYLLKKSKLYLRWSSYTSRIYACI